MKPTLVILVDGLPHWAVDENASFLADLGAKPLRPSLGFSVNLYPHLLAGKTPDDLGFFNKWSLAPEERLRSPGPWKRAALRALDLSRANFTASRILHKALERLRVTAPTGNVPFRLLPYFELSPKREIFDDAPYENLFSFGDWEKIIASYIPRGWGRRDELAVEKARKAISAGASHVFLLLADVDAVAHARGVGGRFVEQIRQTDSWCRELTKLFLRRHGSDARVVVLSDHGMAATERSGGVNPRLEQRFGRASPDTFLYMVEAVMLRVWAWDESLERRIRESLGEGEGWILSPEERAEFGITTPGFGHLIYLLPEGKVFFPNFFGGRFPRAVHGYHPKEDSQQGIVASTLGSTLPHNTNEMYPFLRNVVAG